MKVVLHIAVSADGFIARNDGSVGFLDSFGDETEDFGIGEFMKRVDSVVMGANTYDQYSDHPEFSNQYSGMKLFVFSNIKRKVRSDAVFVSGSVKKFLKSLGKDDVVWLIGGADLNYQFLKEGLIDEFVLTVIPVFIGSGIPLFSKSVASKKLSLVSVERFDSGVVQLTYKKF